MILFLTAALITTTDLASWLQTVPGPRAREPFGALVLETAKAKLNTPYAHRPDPPGPEILNLATDTLECVRLVELSLAVARCVGAADRSEACVAAAWKRIRYRHGENEGYMSRLHYFSEWLDDNIRRRGLEDITERLGGIDVQRPFNFMTRHPGRYPPLASTAIRRGIRSTEERLSTQRFPVIPTARIAEIQKHLMPGDVIAVVGRKPGLLITHVGLAIPRENGAFGLLHASSHRGRVVESRLALPGYMARQAGRMGIMVARPVMDTLPERRQRPAPPQRKASRPRTAPRAP